MSPKNRHRSYLRGCYREAEEREREIDLLEDQDISESTYDFKISDLELHISVRFAFSFSLGKKGVFVKRRMEK